jgi:endonuclease/exonuclease/phosphatase family metal-dependent hydrolase
MNITKTLAVLAIGAIVASGTAFAGSKADVHVMTQNQYLGTELDPIITAETPEAANAAMIQALIELSNNNFPERVQALADSILEKRPHLVALQEVFAFNCVDPFGTQYCGLFANAFNDHLALTMAALGDQYKIAAEVQNLTLAPPVLPFPGIPVFLDTTGIPIFVQVIDRDVILARADIETAPVEFACLRPSRDGCNYKFVAPVSLGDLTFNAERGFVGVDASVNGADYRFINTHLEVKLLGGDPDAAVLQPAQATELWLAILDSRVFDPTKRLLVAGDFNSSPVDVSPIGAPTAYQQLTNGMLINGAPLPFGLTDIWNLRPGNSEGFTCCELADLSNAPSMHYERVDLVFAFPAPLGKVKANVLNAEVEDKTLSGLWPSDHASVSAELNY